MRSRLLKPFGAGAAAIMLVAGGSVAEGAARLQPCASTEYTASIEGEPKRPGPDRMTIVLVGDTGFNSDDAPVSQKGFHKNGKPQEGARRIYALNYLGAQLGEVKTAEGVRFTPRQDGSGLYCAPDAALLGGRLGAMCAAWQPARAIPRTLGRQLASACADKPFYGAGQKKRRKPSSSFWGFGPHKGDAWAP
jgi:hypothetical protein